MHGNPLANALAANRVSAAANDEEATVPTTVLLTAHRSIDELDKAKELYRRVIVQSWSEAGSEEGKARESNMLPAASTNLGNVLQVQGHYEEAVAQHRMAFNLSPETPDAIFNLGVSLIGMGGMGLDEAPGIWGAAVQRDRKFLLRLTNGEWECGP